MDNCTEAVNPVCAIKPKKKCDRLHCKDCKRHLCPVCKQHYRVMIFSESPEGCSTNCIKESTDDTQPWQPPGVRNVIE